MKENISEDHYIAEVNKAFTAFEKMNNVVVAV